MTDKTTMEYRPLGRCGTKVSAFGLGGWTTFGGSVTDQRDVSGLITAAFERVIQEYNSAIDALVIEKSIAVTPPDFYAHFQSHQDEFTDDLHPDGTGYQSMANFWYTALQ